MTTDATTPTAAEPRLSASLAGVLTLWSSTIGKKVVMAATGVLLIGFVVVHMIGNLKIYKGEEAFNHYAAWLREAGAPLLLPEQGLWMARVALLAAVALHILAAWQLSRRSWAARPLGYLEKRSLAATYAARTMRWGGVILAMFVVYHILHLTIGVVGFAPGRFVQLSVYRNVIAGFSVVPVSVFYVVAQVALGLHLRHGAWSLFQTCGVVTARGDRVYGTLATVVALAVVAGNISIPVAVLAGWLR
jgi:succinate dehydrogenase / fumarate reductase cytochrome b subunit